MWLKNPIFVYIQPRREKSRKLTDTQNVKRRKKGERDKTVAASQFDSNEHLARRKDRYYVCTTLEGRSRRRWWVHTCCGGGRDSVKRDDRVCFNFFYFLGFFVFTCTRLQVEKSPRWPVEPQRSRRRALGSATAQVAPPAINFDAPYYKV